MSSWFAPTPERTRAVAKEIAEGSEPKASYYALLVTAAMIACFGLITNSTAVIIGAMLVSPLMTPIFGIAVAMLQGRGRLFATAMRAEMGGVALAVAAAYLFGLLPLMGEATPEMLSRTQPQLLDLLVAVFAGFAGAYALLDERVSPALPGVAIATAIVPPLSTCGLCLASGAFAGAFGAFLLFLANFIAILLVALIMFTIAGMAPAPRWNSLNDISRRFGPVIVGFTVIAVVLTHSLVRMTTERSVKIVVRDVLTSELARDTIALDDFQEKVHGDSVFVLATVRSPKVIPPQRVSELQSALAERLEKPTELIVRTMLAEDVAAAGSTVTANRADLDGIFFSTELTARERKKRLARQVLLEGLPVGRGFRLDDLEYGENSHGTLVFASISTIRPPRADEVGNLEKVLQARLEDPTLVLVIQCSSTALLCSDGPVLIEWTQYGDERRTEPARVEEVRNAVRAELAKFPDTFPSAVHFNIEEGRWRVLAEVSGLRPLAPTELAAVQDAVCRAVSMPLDLNVWYRSDIVVTPTGYAPFGEFTRPTLEKRIKAIPELFAETGSR